MMCEVREAESTSCVFTKFSHGKIIHDIYEFNIFCENITGVKKENLILESKLSDYNSLNNPLLKIMDTLINENY